MLHPVSVVLLDWCVLPRSCKHIHPLYQTWDEDEEESETKDKTSKVEDTPNSFDPCSLDSLLTSASPTF